ncbi:2-amino-4-hydroxy-6-hydroxymethyldihydropteridine diphosphokinase [bacterium]
MSIFLGLGSNLGNLQENLQKALDMITDDHGIRILQKSSCYLTESAGMAEKSFFLNQVISVSSKYRPYKLLKKIESIEEIMGRTQKGIMKSRIIDIDIIAYNDEIISEQILQIPHARMNERLFVLIPLKEIEPEWIHSKTKKHIDELITHVRAGY